MIFEAGNYMICANYKCRIIFQIIKTYDFFFVEIIQNTLSCYFGMKIDKTKIKKGSIA